MSHGIVSNAMIFVFLLLIAVLACVATSMKVVVTGAGGRTGSIVVEKLLASEAQQYIKSQKVSNEVLAIVRTDKSKGKLNKKLLSSLLLLIKNKLDPILDKLIVIKTSNLIAGNSQLVDTFKGYNKLIICTSAVPKIYVTSIMKILLFKFLGIFTNIFDKITRKSEPTIQPMRPQFYFGANGSPYNVDWLGTKDQIDAAKAAGIDHVVLLSSMGGTQPDNFLNTIGKVDTDELSGNILVWKRKAEEYLMKSGLKYTIIHPGGLTDKGDESKEVILGVDDELLKEKARTISRSDVANVCIQSLYCDSAINRSIDIISRDTGKATSDWNLFFSSSNKNCKY